MSAVQPIEDYETVRSWHQALIDQWGDAPSDWNERMGTLAEFCEFAGKDPDTAVRECLRESDAGTKISIKGRRFYSEKIAEWEASLSGDGTARRRAGNVVRSFLIHNGIFLQAGLS